METDNLFSWSYAPFIMTQPKVSTINKVHIQGEGYPDPSAFCSKILRIVYYEADLLCQNITYITTKGRGISVFHPVSYKHSWATNIHVLWKQEKCRLLNVHWPKRSLRPLNVIRSYLTFDLNFDPSPMSQWGIFYTKFDTNFTYMKTGKISTAKYELTQKIAKAT